MPLQPSPWKWPVRSLALAFAACAVLVATPRAASAQTVSQTTGTTLLDYLSDESTPSTHPNNVDATWISYADCENNVYVSVPLSVTVPSAGFSGYSISAFATTISGTDCGQPTSRSGTTGVCWQVLSSSIPVQQNNYFIPVRNLLRDIGQSAGLSPTYAQGTEAACHVATQSGAIPLSLQFIVFDLGGNEISSAVIGLNVELIGPAPPTGITLGVGEGLLKLSWTPVSDPTTQGFNVFIDPLPGHEGESHDGAVISTEAGGVVSTICADAGFTTEIVDSGLEGGEASTIQVPIDGGNCHTVTTYEASASQSSTCPSSILVGGVTGEIDSGLTTPITTTTDDASTVTSTDDGGIVPVVTGTAPTLAQLAQIDTSAQIGGGTQTSATIKGLKDGYVYTVALAAIDNLNDNGPLSTPLCATPSPIDDFYEVYRSEGGLAGGSYCALEGVGEPAGTGALGLIAAGMCVALVRRRAARRAGSDRRPS